MSARERLDDYLRQLRRALHAQLYSRAALAVGASFVVLTCATVWWLQREQYAPGIALAGRALLAVAALCVAVLVWRGWRELRRDDGARLFERCLPDESGRIATYLDVRRREAQQGRSALTDLLADDAARIAERTPVAAIVPPRRILVSAALAAAAVAALLGLLIAGPQYWGYGSRYLWLGSELPRSAVPVRGIAVLPGDATVRRNSDLAIRARLSGFTAEEAAVFVRFDGQEQWEQAPMQQAEGGEFQFRLYAVRAPLQYYVTAAGTQSTAHAVSVVDLPRIERVRLTYAYPSWTGLSEQVDETSRDIRAVEGTNVRVEIFADAPLEAPALIVDGKTQDLNGEGRSSAGNIVVRQPGQYRIAAKVADELVALSEDYTIEIVADEKPVIAIEKPGRDWRATSIEEVPVRVAAEDDFQLREVELRYAVNGGEWHTVPLAQGIKEISRESLLRLEEVGQQAPGSKTGRLAPGDLVSYYAAAKDRRHDVQTDLFMVQVQPFERRFTQAQSGAAGGGMGDEQGAISERQREILLATWNLQRSDERTTRTREQLEDSARMLAELQTTLAQQARTLAERTRARAPVDADAAVKEFVESLERAAEIMAPAAEHLEEFRLAQAVPVEQQALQQLLRAEAAFRDVQVSMQQNGQGAGGLQSARNFSEMFELEMDLEKNQYESESQLSQQSGEQELDEALRKLKALAERQEKLAQQAQRQPQQTEEQRWRQEQLRREAEELRRRLEQMAQQGSASEQGGEQSGSSESSQSSGQRGSADGDTRRALDSVNRAVEQMRAANGSEPQSGEQAQHAAQEASRNLRQALERMERPQPEGLDEAVDELAERTEQLAQQQREIEADLYRALTEGRQPDQRASVRGGVTRERAEALVEAKQNMADALSALQRDMRNAVHENRSRTPESSRRLGDIVNDVESSDLMHRLNRSAAQIYYGRAREAAPSEGLITEAFDQLAGDLRETATQASREAREAGSGVRPEELLAEVAELRRALQPHGAPGSAGQRLNAQPSADGGEPNEEASGEAEARAEGNGDRARQSGSPASWGPAGPQRSGLTAWNTGAPQELPPLEQRREANQQDTAPLGARIDDLARRVDRGRLSERELSELRRMARELRRLSGDPLASQTDAMLRLIDQIELSALAASGRSKDEQRARATLPAPDSPRYREAVAEYYRRLGGS